MKISANAAALACFAGGAASIVAGVWVLCGTGFALISGGISLLLVAGVMARGIANG